MSHWQLVLPPSRPSARHLRLVRQALKGTDRLQPVAVLGSTPEFRDLLHEEGFSDVFVFDHCRRFHRAMSHLRVHRAKETLVYGDWLKTLPKHKARFIAVLSDLTSGNVPYEDRSAFYRDISASLMQNGIFLDKVLTHPVRHLRLVDLERKYTKLPLNLLYANHFSCEAIFCSELLASEEMVDTTAFYRRLDQTFASPRARAFARTAQMITPRGCRWWYGKPWSLLQKSYCPQLRLVANHADDRGSPYYGRVRIIISQKSLP